MVMAIAMFDYSVVVLDGSFCEQRQRQGSGSRYRESLRGLPSPVLPRPGG